jgi:hypothetical protein
MSDDLTKPNTRKLPRPEQIEHLSNDKLVAVILRLAMEISVVRDRLATCESLLQAHGIFDADAVETYQTTPEETAQRTAARMSLIEKVIGDLS